MTPPTIHEFAGIFMLALLTAGLIAHPLIGTRAAQASMTAPASASTNTIPIDGIEDVVLPVRKNNDRVR